MKRHKATHTRFRKGARISVILREDNRHIVDKFVSSNGRGIVLETHGLIPMNAIRVANYYCHPR